MTLCEYGSFAIFNNKVRGRRWQIMGINSPSLHFLLDVFDYAEFFMVLLTGKINLSVDKIWSTLSIQANNA